MKKKIILILLFISIVTPVSFAKAVDCATVSTRVTFLKNNEYRLKIFYLGKMRSNISLAPGLHKLRAQVIYDKTDASDNENTFEVIKDEGASSLINFDIEVKKNIAYQIIASTKEKHNKKLNRTFEILIRKEITKPCKYNLEQQAKTKRDKNNHSYMLPENLQYRLDLVMMDLKAHLLNTKLINRAVTIEKNQRIINTIGIVTNNNRLVTKGINILAITPYSLAEKIGLKPNDTILGINGMDFSVDSVLENTGGSVLSLFKSILVNLPEGENVKIEVMRDNKKITLLSNYKELSLPAYQVQMTIN